MSASSNPFFSAFSDDFVKTAFGDPFNLSMSAGVGAPANPYYSPPAQGGGYAAPSASPGLNSLYTSIAQNIEREVMSPAERRLADDHARRAHTGSIFDDMNKRSAVEQERVKNRFYRKFRMNQEDWNDPDLTAEDRRAMLQQATARRKGFKSYDDYMKSRIDPVTGLAKTSTNIWTNGSSKRTLRDREHNLIGTYDKPKEVAEPKITSEDKDDPIVQAKEILGKLEELVAKKN